MSRGSSTTITVSTDPLANRLRDNVSTPCGVVRSPIPIITVRLPMTVTSPPSMVAGSCASESLP